MTDRVARHFGHFMASNPKVRASSSAQGILGLGGGVLGRVPIRGKGASVSSFFSKWHAGFRRYLHPAGVDFIAPSEVAHIRKSMLRFGLHLLLAISLSAVLLRILGSA